MTVTKSPTFTDFCLAWPKFVGAQIAGIARPAALDHTGTLHIRVQSSAWRDALAPLKDLEAYLLAITSLEHMPVRRVEWHVTRSVDLGKPRRSAGRE